MYLQTDYDYNKHLVEYAKAMGKSGVSIIADKGTFPFKHRIDDLVNFELSIPLKYDIDLKRICMYHQKYFNRLSKEQKQKLVNHHAIVYKNMNHHAQFFQASFIITRRPENRIDF